MSTEHPARATSRLRSLGHALDGVGCLLRTQPNARLHALATLLVVGLGVALELPRVDWLALVVAITVVWTAEAFNTAVEAVCDAASPGFHPLVKRAKDVAAAGVLLSCAGAAVLGALVFAAPLGRWFAAS